MERNDFFSLSESAVRGRARRLGYSLLKSRQWQHVPNLDNFGHYMLVDAAHNFVVLGERYNATLEDIDRWLRNQS